MTMSLVQVKSKKMRKTKQKEDKVNIWAMTVMLTALLISFLIQHYVITVSIVKGDSMKPFLQEDNFILTYDLAYLNHDVDYNDVILIKKKDLNNEIIVKRVIGKPNDKIKIVDGLLIINDEIINNQYSTFSKDYNFAEIIVPKDSYFVIGDNHLESIDSRYWEKPFVLESEIIGQVILKYDDKIKKID